MRSFEHRLPASTDSATLLSLVKKLNADPAVHGILVQLPLPPSIDSNAIPEAIDPHKDVDGFHPVTAPWSGGNFSGGFSPCTPLWLPFVVTRVFAARGLKLAGLRGRHPGRSNIVGKPLAALLLSEKLHCNPGPFTEPIIAATLLASGYCCGGCWQTCGVGAR